MYKRFLRGFSVAYILKNISAFCVFTALVFFFIFGLNSFFNPLQTHAAISLVQSATAELQNVSSLSASFSTGATTGNLLVVVCATGVNTTLSITSPSGFSTAISQSGTPSQGIFYKIAVGGETSITCSFGASATVGVHIYEYSGIDSSSPLDTTGSATGSGTAVSSGSITTTNDNNLLFSAIASGFNGAGTSTFSSWTNSFVERNDFSNGGGSPSARSAYAGADRIVSTTGTYSTGATTSGSGSWRGQIIAFKEATITNSAPSLSSVDLNGGSAITLTENATTTITCTGTITDTNGGSDISSATSSVYRSDLGSSCTADDENCYKIGSSECVLGTPSGNDRSATCTTNIWFFADPTDSGTYSASTWQCEITATDAQSAQGSGTDATPPELNTLVALDVTSSIDYGTLSAGDTVDPITMTTTATTTGNASIDVQLSGTDLTGAGTIDVGQQKYATSSVAYSGATALSGTPTTLELESTKPTENPSNQSDVVYWGISIPAGQTVGEYDGTNTFTAIAD